MLKEIVNYYSDTEPTKEEIAEKMDQVRSNIIKEKCNRASELVRESLSR